MKHIVNSTSHSGPASGLPVPAQTSELVPALVARVYEEAPPALRGRLLEQLLRPLGLLSLAAVANGIFAKITLGNGWYQLKVNGDDVGRVQDITTRATLADALDTAVRRLGAAKQPTSIPVV